MKFSQDLQSQGQYGRQLLRQAGWSQASAQTFQHPGVPLSQAQTELHEAIMVQAHQDPFYSAFIKAQNSSSGSLDLCADRAARDHEWAHRLRFDFESGLWLFKFRRRRHCGVFTGAALVHHGQSDLCK